MHCNTVRHMASLMHFRQSSSARSGSWPWIAGLSREHWPEHCKPGSPSPRLCSCTLPSPTIGHKMTRPIHTQRNREGNTEEKELWAPLQGLKPNAHGTIPSPPVPPEDDAKMLITQLCCSAWSLVSLSCKVYPLARLSSSSPSPPVPSFSLSISSL